MKKVLLIIFQLMPVIISALLIGAHFLRSRNHVFVIICLALPFVLLIRKRISVRIVQFGLLLAGIEWVRTIFILASARADMGLPWTRLTIILGIVACFTVASAFVFSAKTLKQIYGLQGLKKDKDGPAG